MRSILIASIVGLAVNIIIAVSALVQGWLNSSTLQGLRQCSCCYWSGLLTARGRRPKGDVTLDGIRNNMSTAAPPGQHAIYSRITRLASLPHCKIRLLLCCRR